MALIRILTLIASALALLGARPPRAVAMGAEHQPPGTVAQDAPGPAAKVVAPTAAAGVALEWGDLPSAAVVSPAPPRLHPAAASAPARRLPPKPYVARLTSGSSPPAARTAG